jgi:hypothetical protein
MTDRYAPVIEELQRTQINLNELWGPLGTRQARVSLHRPGAPRPDDITEAYADGLRKAADALLKAVATLKTRLDHAQSQ